MEQEQPPPAPRDPAQDAAAGENPSGQFVPGSSPQPEPLRPDLSSPQLTLRAVATGMLLGGLLSVCNVYVGLKFGSAFGMSIVAALLAFGFWGVVRAGAAGLTREWGILENNINQTAASAAASVASAGLVAPIPALTLMTGRTLPWHTLALWVFSVMLIGIAVAVPLRRQMIVVDRLTFPSGVASAEMLREIHERGRAALRRLAALVTTGIVAAAMNLLATFKPLASFAPPFSILGISARSLTMTLSPTLVPLGIGGLIGFRACCSLLAGAILAYGVLSPLLVQHNYIRVPVMQELAALPPGVTLPKNGNAHYDTQGHVLRWDGIMTAAQRDALLALSADLEYRAAVRALYEESQHPQPSYRGDLNRWLLWPGVTLMVVASLVSLAFSWRSIGAALTRWRPRSTAPDDSVREDLVPRRWFVPALAGVLVLSVALQVSLFGIAGWAAALAVLLTFALAVVAARVAGETGIGAVGPMGKITQLVFGALIPKNPVPNLMAANVTGGAASQCADLLDDLKCGHLIGASPRQQTIAQVCGALSGALVGSAAYLILIPDPAALLLSKEWPAPAVAIWKSVAELFVCGLGALPPGTHAAMIVAALAGIALPLLERFGPRRMRPLILSPVSLGLAFALPAGVAFSIFLGGLIALLLRSLFPKWSASYLVAGCVGLIVGESLTGMGAALVEALAPSFHA